jgi:hypothetical protein
LRIFKKISHINESRRNDDCVLFVVQSQQGNSFAEELFPYISKWIMKEQIIISRKINKRMEKYETEGKSHKIFLKNIMKNIVLQYLRRLSKVKTFWRERKCATAVTYLQPTHMIPYIWCTLLCCTPAERMLPGGNFTIYKVLIVKVFVQILINVTNIFSWRALP